MTGFRPATIAVARRPANGTDLRTPRLATAALILRTALAQVLFAGPAMPCSSPRRRRTWHGGRNAPSADTRRGASGHTRMRPRSSGLRVTGAIPVHFPASQLVSAYMATTPVTRFRRRNPRTTDTALRRLVSGVLAFGVRLSRASGQSGGWYPTMVGPVARTH